MRTLPLSINNYYACTVPLEGKAHKPQTSAVVERVWGRLSLALRDLS